MFPLKVCFVVIYNTARVSVWGCMLHASCHVCKSVNKHTARRVELRAHMNVAPKLRTRMYANMYTARRVLTQEAMTD